MMTFNEIKQLFEQYDSIVIFRHFRADYDALGSQLGLKYMLKLNYPDKNVYTYGQNWINNPGFLEDMDNPSDEIIRNSLCVVLDCSTISRVDGQIFKEGKAVLKIDHHTLSEKMGEYEYVDEKASAACLILGQLCKETGLKLDKKSASFIFAGLLTDTNRLSISDCTPEDFIISSYLVSHDVEINKVHQAVFSNDQKYYKAYHYLANKFEFVKDKAYGIFYKEDYEKFGIPMLQAKDMVSLVREVKGVECWVLFYQGEDGLFNASLRSHSKSIVEVARKYGGGGHICASGISNFDEKLIPAILEDFLNC